MGAAVERLMGLVSDESRFDIPYSELRQTQIEALNERFQERKDNIKLLGHRATWEGVKRGTDERELEAAWQPDLKRFLEVRGRYLLYTE